jgi:hypothetical protein
LYASITLPFFAALSFGSTVDLPAANNTKINASVRQFLFDKGLKKSIIGPKEVYSEQ